MQYEKDDKYNKFSYVTYDHVYGTVIYYLDNGGMNLDYHTKYGGRVVPMRVSVDPKDYDYVVKYLNNYPNNYILNKWKSAFDEQMQYENMYDYPAKPSSNKRNTEYIDEEEEGENKDELDISIDDSWSQINEYLLDRYGDVSNSSDSNYKIEIVRPKEKEIIDTLYEQDKENKHVKVWVNRMMFSKTCRPPPVDYDPLDTEPVFAGITNSSRSDTGGQQNKKKMKVDRK